MEKILEIKETTFDLNTNGWDENYEGYIINTDNQSIKVGISTGQSCCENSGYGMLSTNDDIEDFIGKDLIAIKIVDKELVENAIEDLNDLDYGGGAMFVNFETSNGVFQIVAYNVHNGYYGHDAVLITNEINHSEIL